MNRKDEAALMQKGLDEEDTYIAKLEKEAPKCKKCGAPILGEECDNCEGQDKDKDIIVKDGKLICPYCKQQLPEMFNGDCEQCGKIFCF